MLNEMKKCIMSIIKFNIELKIILKTLIFDLTLYRSIESSKRNIF
jgi:hypothetical protein